MLAYARRGLPPRRPHPRARHLFACRAPASATRSAGRRTAPSRACGA